MGGTTILTAFGKKTIKNNGEVISCEIIERKEFET
jgi:hypothetical protein